MTGVSFEPNAECARPSMAHWLSINTECPGSAWLDAVSPIFAAGAPRLVALNIGANKGYMISSWLQRFGAYPQDSPNKWHRMLIQARGAKMPPTDNDLCGVCRACKDNPVRHKTKRPVELHAFELLPPNAEVIRKAVSQIGLVNLVNPARLGPKWTLTQPHPFVAVSQAAVSNTSGTAWIPGTHDDKIGKEDVSATLNSKPSGAFIPVEMLSIDNYLEHAGIERVAFASVDTEGFDALVLEGMQRTLSRGLIDVLEFECDSLARSQNQETKCSRP